ncbi:hypothetical protein [Mycolicibacterium phlei]|uniref:hypothetical protein n=1 Tax=Mycolicibacterium phlei TaxID=1771 RepID=UPI00058CE435|nr:hypothetical protein [Mycolicibacterium phlei]MBF4194627.1 hypothetical protein [Mycolicibacterium phlei]
MSTLTLPDIDLESLFEESIPCDICGEPAALRSLGHIGVKCVDDTPHYKCRRCFEVWYRRVLQRLSMIGIIVCADCYQIFTSIEEFSDYREF